MTCEQCPRWTGHGCICEVFPYDDDDDWMTQANAESMHQVMKLREEAGIDPNYRIPCHRCSHESLTPGEAFEHWCQHRTDKTEPLMQKGMLVAVVLRNGELQTGRVTDVVFNKKTGEEKVEIDGGDKFERALAMLENVNNMVMAISQPQPRWRRWLRRRW
jgi:hypothetical protein